MIMAFPEDNLPMTELLEPKLPVPKLLKPEFSLTHEKRAALICALMPLIILSISMIPACTAQDVISHRDLVIDLGSGLKTDAEVTLPVEGNGTFPGILLIQGSGATDMNEYLPPLVTGSDQPSRPFLQIAEYLSSRGFVVLRYNKRGVGLNGTVLNASVLNNATFQDLEGDAEKALAALEDQPEVDRSDIAILGHSEGTAIATRIALNDKAVKKIVLMAAFAGNLKDILYFQLVTRPLLHV